MLSKVLLFTLATAASAFAPSAFAPRGNSALNANIVDTLKTLQGPGVCWGSEGPPLGHEENEVRFYNNFNNLVKAVSDAGLAQALSGPGPFTVFAPVNTAFEESKVPASADLLKYHVVPGKFTLAQITGDLKTLQGSSLQYSRKFRKTFVDDAIVGQEDNFGGGSKYPVDIVCDNGIIHAISTVLAPGYVAPGAEAGLGGVTAR
mmetsp:Transcript_13865/g.19855  ORF Transcript_13865/g.19855 Transcript_13865/m.19855 type:complete len:204 (+) Transcript_13865:95-706(+)|eukprot:CAMPEP_0172414618 /NCGR_PEP_ID=MMETSP1064-20121228/1259_1 /TAXON_ID=202472 /ORGANISM="Aulacoseira subarctica , Strain CCAP 1002/5" /LENGTH=203 /DNA_ID=CAMNT_0013151371 /DNA_START=93 /DNA_END=704 /DNA_ORIENTATION=-